MMTCLGSLEHVQYNFATSLILHPMHFHSLFSEDLKSWSSKLNLIPVLPELRWSHSVVSGWEAAAWFAVAACLQPAGPAAGPTPAATTQKIHNFNKSHCQLNRSSKWETMANPQTAPNSKPVYCRLLWGFHWRILNVNKSHSHQLWGERSDWGCS